MRHCQFVERLIYKSVFYKDIEIHKCKEHYTTQSCPKCGSKKTLRDKTIECKNCNFVIHRDLGGSVNMVFKSLKYNN